MKSIEIRDPARLSLGKCMELVLSGIRFRLFRAIITVAIIAMAVAFLMTMLSESILGRRVDTVIKEQARPHRMFLFWADRLAKPMSGEELTEQLQGMSPQGPRWQEFQSWAAGSGTSLSDEQMQSLADIASRQQMYISYFEGLNAAQRRPLVGSARGSAILVRLVDKPGAMEQFQEARGSLNEPLPTSPEAFEQFLADWNRTRPWRQAILDGHAQAVAGLHEQDAKRKVIQQVWANLAGGGASYRQRLLKQGFVVSEGDFQTLSQQAAFARDAAKLAPLVSVGEFKRDLARHLGAEVQQIDARRLYQTVAEPSEAQWLLEELQGLRQRVETLSAQKRELDAFDATVRQFRDVQDRFADSLMLDLAGRIVANELAEQRKQMRLVPREENLISPSSVRLLDRFDLSADRIVEVARYQVNNRELTAVAGLVTAATGSQEAFFGFSVRTMWLLAVSFVVCVVGIANAMLMSVTERFREIATMKCLGATDGFIMINFILESIMQGVAGGAVGTVAGFLLGLTRGWGRYGMIVLENFPIGDLLFTALVSFVIGMVVSALAAVYPAWVAARLAPMEAMRVE